MSLVERNGTQCNATMDLTPRQEATSIDQQRLVHPRTGPSDRDGWMDGWMAPTPFSRSCFLDSYGTACLQSPSTRQVHACHTQKH
ncbi:hypothetical protein BDA96_10G351700 [Sorghum bicolor]|uniref:Uncharacterized protein n=1 Tax=Sorghum bicolor TaxID=4558 RepID=A0A921Q734_SORBI|nr:hypothetical protein BDA96_10G351700 [Sorghum bicolor]